MPSNVSSPVVEELPSTEIRTATVNTNDESEILPTTINNNDGSSSSTQISLPGSDRQTRGFRVHIERKTHTVTRTNKKQKLTDTTETSTMNIKQEPIEINNVTCEAFSSSSSSSSTTTNLSIKGSIQRRRFFFFFHQISLHLESKRSCTSKTKRHLSPPIENPLTLNILSSTSDSSSPKNKTNKKQRPIPVTSASPKNSNCASNVVISTIEKQRSPSLIRSMPPLPPPIDPRNPVTWNVNDVCWYLNQSGCSFALKIIKEQVKKEILYFLSI